MDANPLRTIRDYLNVSPGAKWAALIASATASLCLVALFPVLYLFADLLVWQGHVPGYAGLPAGQQRAFRAEWDAKLKDTAVADTLNRIRPAGANLPEDVEWMARWQAATHAWLLVQVGPEAADAYMPTDGVVLQPTRTPVGLLSPVARERGRWTGAVLAAVARLFPWTWQPADGRSENGAYLTLLFAAGFGLCLLRGVLLYAAASAAAVAAGEGVTRLRRTLHTHSYRLPAVAIKPDAQAEAGEILTTRVEQIRDGFLAWLTAGVRGPVTFALLLLVLLTVHPWLAISLLLLGGLVWLVAGRVAAWYRHDGRVAARKTEARLELLRESLSNCPLVKGYLMDRFSQTRVERHLTELGRAAWRRQRADAASRTALLTVVALAGMAMLYLAGWVVLGGELTFAGLVVLAAGLGTLAFALNRWLVARARMTRAKSAALDVAEFLDRRGEPGQPIDAEFLQPLAKRLDAVGVSLREPGTGHMILEAVSLSIPAGTKAAVVYSDAEEAHALAFLLARFLDPTAGEIKIDGKNIRWVTYESLRTQVCLILEQSLTFSDTAANNIGCGDAGFTLPQIIDAAKRAHAHQFIQSLPYGYETRIGAGGVSLRVGERFRIALARAILRDPSVVVIEEPAEPMDPDSAALVDDALAQFQAGRTLIFLARRPATVKAADQVFVLQNGHLAASGSHEELFAASELYRLLHFKQTLTAPEPV